MSGRSFGGRDGGRGGGRGFGGRDSGRGGGRGGRDGGRGGRGGFDEGPPAEVVIVGTFMHEAEGEMVCKLATAGSMIPYFNAGVYLENKSKIGKVEEVFGPVNKVYFTIKPDTGVKAASFKMDDKVYIGTDKLLPLARFTNEAKSGGGRGGGRGAGRGAGRGPPGRGGGRGPPGRGGFGGGRGGPPGRGGFGGRGGSPPGRGSFGGGGRFSGGRGRG